jgi:hypothetical protein
VSVDDLRQQLRDRGYLSHGIERWFALDPWSSRAFWWELAIVALKAATLIAVFGALPFAAVMVFRNYPLHALETLGLFVTYGAAWLAASFAFVMLVALVLKVRPSLPIDTPRALLAISLGASALFVAPLALWWSRFDASPSTAELVTGAALAAAFFLVTTVVVSAALLSFSIYELQRIPAIHQKPRGVPMAIAAAVLIALLFVPAYAQRERPVAEPMIVTTPTTRNVALIAVDGLTVELLRSRPDLGRELRYVTPATALPGASTTERWASIGTGVRTDAHGVRAIEGVRFRGGRHIIQRISPGDFVLMNLAPAIGIARREPLPPTVRRRDYVWEIFAKRGLPVVSTNWWTTAESKDGALISISPETVFTAAQGQPLRLDQEATARFLAAVDASKPRFATVYLPALDVILNRLERDRNTQVVQSVQALDGVQQALVQMRTRGYEVVLIGLPGEEQSGQAVIASSIPIKNVAAAWDVAPTLLALMGFPLSSEMPGNDLASASAEPRIATYGSRVSATAPAAVNEDYYENLKSLGYIQ